jgi:hypothetical protein
MNKELTRDGKQPNSGTNAAAKKKVENFRGLKAVQSERNF